jgi:cysteine desulfurase
MKALYFDYNATTPVLPEVRESMSACLEDNFGNPSSVHGFGLKAKLAVNEARNRVAALLNAKPEQIVFTSCATEANNGLLRGLFPEKGAHLVTTAIEHPSILAPAAALEAQGVEVTRVRPNRTGVVDAQEILDACRPDTRLVSIMLANNETGAIQPVKEIAQLAGAEGYLVHTDASQAVGKIPVDAGALGVDFLSLAGHKLYAPKGVGALYARSRRTLAPLLLGGGQEDGSRGGTENVPHIVGLGAACELARNGLDMEISRQRRLGEIFDRELNRLARDLEQDILNLSQEADRLPNTRFVGFKHLDLSRMLEELGLADVAVSAGAACHDGETSISHVLEAMGAPVEYAACALRFSWGRPTTEQDVMDLMQRLSDACQAIRSG